MTSGNTFSSVRKTATAIFAFCLIGLWGQLATAQDKRKRPSKKSDKVDVSDLENKYWAPKDTDFSVVQNRTYTKEGQFAISAQGGIVVNEEWNEGSVYGVTADYYFSERYGVELSYLTMDLEPRDNAKGISDLAGGIQPDHGRVSGRYSVGFTWVPFYAKMSVLGKQIIYFDMAFTPNIGMTQYDQIYDGGSIAESAFSYGIDVTQYFFFDKNFAARIDLKNSWFTEDIVKYRKNAVITPGVETGEVFRDKLTNTTLFMMGIMFYF